MTLIRSNSRSDSGDIATDEPDFVVPRPVLFDPVDPDFDPLRALRPFVLSLFDCCFCGIVTTSSPSRDRTPRAADGDAERESRAPPAALRDLNADLRSGEDRALAA